MSKSEERTDWLGNKYTVHLDDDGNEIGESRDEKDWIGNHYPKHTDSDGNKTGESRDETDWIGNHYTKHTDSDGNKIGESRDETDWIGNHYTKHTGLVPYVTRQGSGSALESDSGSTIDDDSSSSYEAGSGSYSSSDSSSSTGSGAGGVAGLFVLAVLAVVILSAINSSDNSSSSTSQSSDSEPQQTHTTPTGFTVPPYTFSPNRRYGVIAPDFAHHKEGIHQNAIVEIATGRLIATIEAETEFVDPNIRRGHSHIQPRWSADNSLLLWEVSGKWSPMALMLIRVDDGVVRWQIDLLKTAQQEMLARTRKANPQRYAAAKKANAGNGSAYPDGFTIDVTVGDTPTSSIRLPLPIRARLTSNPKQIDDLPTVEAQLEGTVDTSGNVVFRRYHFGHAQ